MASAPASATAITAASAMATVTEAAEAMNSWGTDAATGSRPHSLRRNKDKPQRLCIFRSVGALITRSVIPEAKPRLSVDHPGGLSPPPGPPASRMLATAPLRASFLRKRRRGFLATWSLGRSSSSLSACGSREATPRTSLRRSRSIASALERHARFGAVRLRNPSGYYPNCGRFRNRNKLKNLCGYWYF